MPKTPRALSGHPVSSLCFGARSTKSGAGYTGPAPGTCNWCATMKLCSTVLWEVTAFSCARPRKRIMATRSGASIRRCTFGSLGCCKVSSLAPADMLKGDNPISLTARLKNRCIHGEILFSGTCWLTGMAIAILYLRLFPPKLQLASKRNPLLAASLRSPFNETAATASSG